MSVVGFLVAAAATAWTAVAVAIVIGSTLDTSDRLVLSGRTVATVTASGEVFACVGLGMSVAAIAAAWIVGWIRRSDERRLRADVDRRWEEISTRGAGMEARNELLEWRLLDLQEQIDVLIARRDELLADADRDLASTKEAVRATRSRESLRRRQEGIIVLSEPDPVGGVPPAPPTRAGNERSGAPDGVRRFPA